MDIRPILHADEGHLILRRSAPLAQNGLRGDDGVVINVVIIDAGNRQVQFLQISISQNHVISLPDTQILGNAGRQQHLILSRQRQLGSTLMEINEAGQFLSAGKQVDLLHPVVKVQFHAALMVKHHAGRILLCHFSEFIPLTLRGFLPEVDGNIIFCHIFKLIIRNIGNGIPQSEAS